MGAGKKIGTIFLCLLMVVCSLQYVPSVQVEAANVIEIRTVDDLYNVNNNLSGNYILMNDIDLSEATAEGGKYDYLGNGWRPIGCDDTYKPVKDSGFCGSFNGNGYSVKGMRIEINNSAASNREYELGLFGKLGQGTIKNLKVEGFIKATVDNRGANVGAIVGKVGEQGTLLNCGSDCDIYVCSGPSGGAIAVGGVTGTTFGRLKYCYNRADIKAISYVDQACVHIGGIAGSSYCGEEVGGDIKGCYNTGNITTTMELNESEGGCTTGGICGAVVGDKEIGYRFVLANNYNTGNITANATGKKASAQVGGIIGAASIYTYLTIQKCYSIGKLESTGHKSAIGGSVFIFPITVENCYYLEGQGEQQEGAIPLSVEQLNNRESFEGFDFYKNWTIDRKADYQYPQLRENRQDVFREIDSIEILSLPDKQTYYTGDELVLTGARLKVYYSDATTEEIAIKSDMVSGYDTNVAGEQEITVKYRNLVKTFIVHVEQKKVVSILVKESPDKTSYIEGQTFDSSGMVVEAVYNNGERKIVTDYTVEEIGHTVGERDLVISYQGATTTVGITVLERKVESLNIKRLPKKIVYFTGDVFDASGLIVEAVYNDASKEIVSDYNLSDTDTAEAGVKVATISFAGKTAVFQYSVVEPKVSGLKVKGDYKKHYIEGEELDFSGLEIFAEYTNGKVEKVLLNECKVEGYTGEHGKNTVALSYHDASYSLEVDVHKATDIRTVQIKPDCVHVGEKISYCTVCNSVIAIEQTNALGHNFVIINEKKADYFSAGYTGDKKCKNCGIVEIKGKSIPKLILKRPVITVKAGKKKVKVTIGKVQGAVKYQIRIKKGNKWKTYTTSKLKKTIKGLTKGKRYKIKVRAVAIKGEMKANSKYSKTVKIRVK